MSTRQRAEANQTRARTEQVSVTWRKKAFHLPSPEEFPLEAIELEEEGKHLAALRMILGAEQYARWREVARTLADVEDFSATVMRLVGRGNR